MSTPAAPQSAAARAPRADTTPASRTETAARAPRADTTPASRTETAARAPRADSAPAISGAHAAMITAVSDTPGRVEVRVLEGDGASFPAAARLALAAPYSPEVGDRVVVAGGAELFVIGVLLAARPPSVALPCGGSVTIDGGSVAIADAAGRVIVRYRDGEAEIAAPAGDLVLSAPAGSVTVRAASGVSIETSGTLAQRAERITATASELVQHAERLETRATRLFEHTRDTFRETANLLQTRAGRARTLVRELFSVNAGRTSMTSTEETAIDGSRVLIG
jgi:hypothetical protein